MIVDVYVIEEMVDFGVRGGFRVIGLFIFWFLCSEFCCSMFGVKIDWRKIITIFIIICLGVFFIFKNDINFYGNI